MLHVLLMKNMTEIHSVLLFWKTNEIHINSYMVSSTNVTCIWMAMPNYTPPPMIKTSKQNTAIKTVIWVPYKLWNHSSYVCVAIYDAAASIPTTCLEPAKDLEFIDGWLDSVCGV